MTQLAHCWHGEGVKGVHFGGVDGDTHSTWEGEGLGGGEGAEVGVMGTHKWMEPLN